MPTTLTEHAEELSTYTVVAAFKDAAGSAVTPKSVVWTLTDMEGIVINSREDVSVTPATSVTIVLSGGDLAFKSNEIGTVKRIVTVEAVYDSDEGSDLPLNEEIILLVDPLINVSLTYLSINISDSMTLSEAVSAA